MLNDELERMAREAGLATDDRGRPNGYAEYCRRLTHFATLVAAAEREACAKLCERMKSKAWADEAVVRAHNTAASNCAAAIRVRPNSN